MSIECFSTHVDSALKRFSDNESIHGSASHLFQLDWMDDGQKTTLYICTSDVTDLACFLVIQIQNV